MQDDKTGAQYADDSAVSDSDNEYSLLPHLRTGKSVNALFIHINVGHFCRLI